MVQRRPTITKDYCATAAIADQILAKANRKKTSNAQHESNIAC
jgi:hypothetical protein